jgi:aconitate hydratase
MSAFATRARRVTVNARGSDGRSKQFEAIVRVDTPQEALYYQHGGILQYVLRQLLQGKDRPEAVGKTGVAVQPQA